MDPESVIKLGDKLQKDDPTPEIFDEIQRNVCFLLPVVPFSNAIDQQSTVFPLDDLTPTNLPTHSTAGV